MSDRDGMCRVEILEDDAPVLERGFSGAEEAEVFASTVRQHMAWLSPERFRAYYRL